MAVQGEKVLPSLVAPLGGSDLCAALVTLVRKAALLKDSTRPDFAKAPELARVLLKVRPIQQCSSHRRDCSRLVLVE